MPEPTQFTIQDRAGFSDRWTAGRLTMIDIAIQSGQGLAELIDETTRACPEFTLVPVKPIKGTNYEQMVRTQLPKVGFRRANQGAIRSKGSHEKRLFNCHIFDPRWEADVAVADANPEGAAPIIAEAAEAIMLSAWQSLGLQFYYGTAADSEGCPGLLEIFDYAKMELNAAGTTDNQKSSVWLLHLANDHIQWLLGGNKGFGMSDITIRDVYDSDNQAYEAYVQGLKAHIGLSVRNLRSVCRIKNLTKEAGKSLTGNLVMEAILKMPTGQMPTVALMNKTQREELRKSRITDLLPDPPMPTDVHGIPIVCTDSIVDGHAAELA